MINLAARGQEVGTGIRYRRNDKLTVVSKAL